MLHETKETVQTLLKCAIPSDATVSEKKIVAVSDMQNLANVPSGLPRLVVRYPIDNLALQQRPR